MKEELLMQDLWEIKPVLSITRKEHNKICKLYQCLVREDSKQFCMQRKTLKKEKNYSLIMTYKITFQKTFLVSILSLSDNRNNFIYIFKFKLYQKVFYQSLISKINNIKSKINNF